MAEVAPTSTVLDFSREDEHRLADLRRRVDDPQSEPLTPAEQHDLLRLEQKYARFQEDGLRKLRECADMKKSPDDSSLTKSVTNLLSGVARGALFWGSLIGTAAPGYLGKKIGVTDDYKHWNWITDHLILGALPVVSQVGASGNHLEMIREQCAERGVKVGLVVSALTADELNGFGVVFPRFASHEDWQAHLGVRRFELVEIADMTARTDYATILRVTEKIHIVINEAKEAVYVHCKAGKGRSWMIVMCYLCSYGRMSFDDAVNLVQLKRYQVNPSQSQIKFVKDFAQQFAASETARRLLDTSESARQSGRAAADEGWVEDCRP